MSDWQPSASMEQLGRRAGLLAAIRAFFAERHVMEVDVPVLATAAVTDPNIECFAVHPPGSGAPQYFLTPSPEFYMKRLLAAGSGPIYFLGHAFRAGDCGSRHQPEFAMLEWYRPGWSLQQLIEEVMALVTAHSGLQPWRQCSYRDAFAEATGLDPLQADLGALEACARHRLSPAFDSDDRDVWLDLLFSHLVEPGLRGHVVVTDFPPSQAALAQCRTDERGDLVAARFELYINGMEIANGYQEECDVAILAQRFADDLAIRSRRGRMEPLPDARFLAAMGAGLPPCAGVALGVDRWLMAITGTDRIAGVVPFGF